MAKKIEEEKKCKTVSVDVEWIPDADKKKFGVILPKPMVLYVPEEIEGVELDNYVNGWLNLKYAGLYNGFKIAG